MTDAKFPRWSHQQVRPSLADAARHVLSAYQQFLDTDDLDVLRDAVTELQFALEDEAPCA